MPFLLRKGGLGVGWWAGAGRVWQKLADAWGDSIDGINLSSFRCFSIWFEPHFCFPPRGLRVRPVGTPFNQKAVFGIFFQNKFHVSAVEIKSISLTEYPSFVLCSWYQWSRVNFCLMLRVLPKSLYNMSQPFDPFPLLHLGESPWFCWAFFSYLSTMMLHLGWGKIWMSVSNTWTKPGTILQQIIYGQPFVRMRECIMWKRNSFA